MTYQDLVNRAQARLRCNLCMSPERSVRKAMLKNFPSLVSIQHSAHYADGAPVASHDGTFSIDSIISDAVRQNNALYGNYGKSIRVIKEIDRIKGDRYVYLNK